MPRYDTVFCKYIRQNAQLFALIFLSIFGYALKYGLNLTLSHYLSLSLFGEFNLAARVLNILMAVALLGTDISSKRFVAHYLKNHDQRVLQRYIQWNFSVIKHSFLFCVIVGVSSYAVMRYFHVWHIKAIESYHMAVYMFWVAPIAALFMLLTNYLNCANYSVLSNALKNVRVMLYIVLFVGFIVWLDMIELHAYTLSLLLLLSFFLLFISECVVIYYRVPILFKSMRDAIFLKRSVSSGEKWLSFSARMAVNNLVFIVICAVDLFLVELICPNKEDVGLYSAALVVASLVLVVPQNIYVSFKTEISHLADSKHGRAVLENHVKVINRLSFLVILILGVGIILFSDSLLSYFGPHYRDASTALEVLTLGFMATGFAQPASLFIVYSGHDKMVLNVSLVELMIILTAGIPLTYFWGIVGTALATTLSIWVKTLYFHLQVYFKLHIKAFVC